MTVDSPVQESLASYRIVEVVYGEGESAVHALAGASPAIGAHERVALLARSGSGKRTPSRVLDLIDALQAEFAFSLVLATHDGEVASRLDRRLELEDGSVAGEQTQLSPLRRLRCWSWRARPGGRSYAR